MASYADRLALRVARRLRAAERAEALTTVRLGPGSTIGEGFVVYGTDRVSIGARVRIGQRARLQAIESFGGVTYDSRIVVGDGTTIEDDCHIGAAGLVEIGRDVLVAGGVYVTDHRHRYDDVDVPVRDQPLDVGTVTIGDGSHIGENACVLGPLSIGAHAVVGANAVVVRDVAARTVVAGVPARVVRRWDDSARAWVAGP
jgi:acetyltransferase-like isoleucine patch superfamily enzyme